MRAVAWVGRNVWIAVLVFVVGLVSPTLAQELPGARESLAGLAGVYVIVEDIINPDVERGGLAWSTLQTDVEVKLRLAGIRVLTKTEWHAAPGSPFLSLYAQAVGLGKERLVYGPVISLGLYQKVVLARNPTITLHARTWSSLTSGVTVAKSLYKVREDVRDRVDEFINAYLAANPK